MFAPAWITSELRELFVVDQTSSRTEWRGRTVDGCVPRLFACTGMPLDEYCCLFWKAQGKRPCDRESNNALGRGIFSVCPVGRARFGAPPPMTR